ncbi:helicase-exonuclease AddAB subunit AddA [Proteiniborus sp. MB09-C3]|uniref:helicase-exonuclease AddAB subunit AddA n=1 Tax=Proteiniborus sp. MB09-C3 TaxID=3050072 RepID=UPI002553E77F|nr:helicase-exonuclease AddAB subunit AddA [Proteiniborus sp. MB09-C3]WIV10640.1 helicase-exonuclease AddAB subunit AddA [Proteiniborus sp. MB09-C3]
MPKWTDAQKEAIAQRGCNLLVSAAAGSGKTAVLVERIIRLVTEDMVDIDKLLIVTFTNAAAGEMRERILLALMEEIEKGGENEEKLRRQITLLNKSHITTVHSFCINVVRRHFHLIDIDPAFKIGDTTELQIMLQDVLEELLESEYEKGHEDFIRLVESYGGNKNDVNLENLILKIYSFIQSKPYPEKWLDEMVEMFKMNQEELEESVWIETIEDSIKIDLSGARDLVNEAIKICNKANGPESYIDALRSDLQNIEALEETLKSDGVTSFNKCIANISHDKLKRVSKDVDEGLKKEAAKLRDNYKAIIDNSLKKDISNKSIESYLTEINELYPIMKYLYHLVVEFSQMYANKKLEKGIIDFNDLEHYALRILESEEVRAEYRNKFEYIFVDEYQDSNIVQETIVNRMKRDNNLFFVGDVKQSIYRFRLADPSLFLEKYNSYVKDESGLNKRIDLSKNFRSRKEILDGVNYIFENIMSEKLGEVEYNEAAFLYEGAEYEKHIDNDTPIEIDIIEKTTDGIEDLDEDLEEMASIEVEARIVANRIKELICKTTYDAKKKKFRKIEYKDMVILLRTMKNWASVFNEVFKNENIPVYTDDNTGYLDALEIKIFLNFLSIIDNKRQDISLLSVMRSPIGGFTTEELISIRISNKGTSYYSAIESYIKTNKDSLSNKLSYFLDNLNKWAEEARYAKLDEFIWKLMIDTGYYHYFGAMPGGIQRQANLRILVDRACEFDKSTSNGLFNFIRFIERLKSSSGDMGTAKTIGENENVVRIMSVHKSKGLEFPAVILAGLGKQFNLMDARDDILIHKDLGLGPKYVDVLNRRYTNTLPQIAIKKKVKLESLSEEMRVLYVALTRAKDRLILIGSVKDIPKEAKKWCKETNLYYLSNSKNYFDWILGSIAKHSDGDIIRELAGVDDEYEKANSGEAHWKIRILTRKDLHIGERQEAVNKKEFREKLENFHSYSPTSIQKEIEKRFDWSYELTNSINIPSKMSVSDIKKASLTIEALNYKIPSIVKMPRFLEGKKPFTKAEIGTIIHFVMQHLNLNVIIDRKSIEKKVDDMIVEELLTEEEAKVVNIDKILNFYRSSIGLRLLSSKSISRETPFVLKKKASEVLGVEDCKENVLIQGIVDCYFEEDDGLILIDYKTDSILEGNLENIVDKYRGQMMLYKEALEKITERKVKEIYIYSFELDKEVKVE